MKQLLILALMFILSFVEGALSLIAGAQNKTAFIYPCAHGTSVWCLRTKQDNEYERAKHHYDSGMGQDVPIE